MSWCYALLFVVSAMWVRLTAGNLVPYIENGKHRPCDWMSQCPAGTLCDVRREFSAQAICFKFGQAATNVSEVSKIKPFHQRVNDAQCPDPDQVSTCQACTSVTDCPEGFVCCSNGQTRSCTAPIGNRDTFPEVMPLLVGSYQVLNENPLMLEMNGSVTLVKVQRRHILVDTGTMAMKENLVNTLHTLGLNTDDISLTIVTHGHPDHYANTNLFRDAHNFGSYKVVNGVFIANPLTSGDRYFLCTKNVYLIRTPGHSSEDVTVIAENAGKLGTVAITGDLFMSEDDVRKPEMWRSRAWNTTIQEMNQRKIACLADYIVPGHGAMFKVSDFMRQYFRCG